MGEYPSWLTYRLQEGVVGAAAVIADLVEVVELRNLHTRVAEVVAPKYNIQVEVRRVQVVDLLGVGVREQQVKCPGQVVEQLLEVEEDLESASPPIVEVAHPSMAAWVAAAAAVENRKKLLRYREVEEPMTSHHGQHRDPSTHQP